MNMKLPLLIAFFSLALSDLPAQNVAGELLEKTIIVENIERKYLLYLPAGYDGSEEWPLVFNLHGANSNAQAQVFISGMNTVSDTGRFLVTYPQGISNAEGLVGWNDPGLPELQDDIQFIGALIDSIAEDYAIDLLSVYATGMSNGGAMSYTLACALSDRIAAVASVSAPGGNFPDCSPESPIPILYMHGTADLIVPFEGGVGIFVPLEFPAAREQLQFWLDHNGCSAEPIITDLPDINSADASTVTLEKYSSCEGSSEVWFYQINNGGHTWPGGPPQQIPPGFEAALGKINLDIKASSEIWNFFNRQQLVLSNKTVPPAQFNLHIYPNPFSEELTFEFELPEVARVQLDLYNPLGQRVVRIANQRMNRGTNQIQWQRGIEALSKGLYFYRLQIGERTVSQPIIVR